MTQIHILFSDNKYYVVLRHEDGSEEISDQSWDTKEECQKAVEQYAKDRGMQMTRTQ